MTGNKFIAILAAMIAGAAALAVAALYIDWQRLSAPPAGDQRPVAADEKASTPSAAQAKPNDATSALSPPSEPTAVPTFDVVVIEPSGEGVIAGRAAPGWKVSVQAGGVKVAEAKADLQGEWSVVLEKPLASGDHALSLKIVSPDGTRSVSSQETVKVAVGNAQAASPAAPGAVTGTANVAPQSVPQAGSPEALAAVEPNVTRALARAEQEALAASAAGAASVKPALVFKTVDYELSDNGAGTITITGTSEPGAGIVIFYGKERLAETRADRAGSWKVAVAKTLGLGEHSFRAERTGAAPGTTVAAVISIERAEPKPEPAAPEVAARDLAASGPATQAATPGGPSDALRSKEVYTIRRGDTLWAIAKRYLGSGLRYTAIFQDNRGTINNPNLIHPQQEVSIPGQ